MKNVKETVQWTGLIVQVDVIVLVIHNIAIRIVRSI
jgi:hypothetical protein